MRHHTVAVCRAVTIPEADHGARESICRQLRSFVMCIRAGRYYRRVRKMFACFRKVFQPALISRVPTARLGQQIFK
jgi:hypothetical protein